MRQKQGVLALLVLLALAACAGPRAHPTATSSPFLVTFSIDHLSVDPSGKLHLDLSVTNNGRRELPADQFVANLDLARGDGTWVARQDTLLPRVPSSTGAMTIAFTANTPLEPGVYRASWGTASLGYTLTTFEVIAQNGGIETRLVGFVNYPPGPMHPVSSWGQ